VDQNRNVEEIFAQSGVYLAVLTIKVLIPFRITRGAVDVGGVERKFEEYFNGWGGIVDGFTQFCETITGTFIKCEDKLC
jgi:hypothetical protein